MADLVDISVALRPDLPVWPSGSGHELRSNRREADGDTITGTELRMDVHSGTHVEAPLHFLRDGAPLDRLGLEPFVGPAAVVDVGDADVIDAKCLARASVPPDVSRLLLRSSNSTWWPSAQAFRETYVALDESGAAWCAERSFLLVGIDFLSIQSWHASARTHRILMEAGIAILEGLDLSSAPSGPCELLCLPLALPDVEGAPARAVLRPVSA